MEAPCSSETSLHFKPDETASHSTKAVCIFVQLRMTYEQDSQGPALTYIYMFFRLGSKGRREIEMKIHA